MGGTRQRQFAGVSFEPQKLPENAARPTRRVHAVLGALTERLTRQLEQAATAKQQLDKIILEAIDFTMD